MTQSGKHFLTFMTATFFLFSCGGNAGGDTPGKDDDGGNNQTPTTEFQEEADDPAADPQGLFDYSRLMSQPHPRLMMNDADFAALKERIQTDEVVRKFSDMIVSHADDVVNSNPARLKYQITDGYLVYVAWVAVDRIMYCTYAYRLTGEQKYLTQLQKDLQDVCLFQDWYPEHYLGTGELAMATAFAYDWCYKDLSLTTRKMVRSALNLFAFQTVTQNIYKRTNNWNPVCLCGLTFAAIATYEKNKSASVGILDASVNSNALAQETSYSPGGVYPEGYNYWGYGTMTEAAMLTAFKKCFGKDNGLSAIKGWDKTGDYILYMVGPTGQSFNYSDCGPGCSPKVPMWYFASEFNRPDLLNTELRMLNAGLYPASAEWRFMPLAMPWVLAAQTSSGVSAPEKKVWASLEGEVPVALIRDGWNWDETDKYLAIKGGKAHAAHGHMDAGSFVYEAFGQRWADDIGPEEYAPLEALFAQTGHKLFAYERTSKRWTCFRLNAFSHNTVHINDDIHDPEGQATITKVYEQEYLGADLDMSAPLGDYVNASYRKFRLTGDVLSIKDSFSAKSGKICKISWHFATTAAVTLEADKIKLEKGGKTVYLSVSGSGATPELKVYEAKGVQDYDTPNPGYTMVGWEATVPAGSFASFDTLIQP